MNLNELAKRYEEGATFEELALDEGCTQATMRKALLPYVTPRRKGQQAGKPHKNNSRSKTDSGPRTGAVPGHVPGHGAKARYARKLGG